MAHPVMYDDADPHFQRVRTLALALPQAQMKVSHGRPAFFTQKVFAYYGASVKASPGLVLPHGGDHHDDGSNYVQYPRAVMVKVEGADVDVLAQDARAFRPAYLASSGWWALDLFGLDPDAAADSDGWTEVAEWIETSYRLTAPARLVRQLDR